MASKAETKSIIMIIANTLSARRNVMQARLLRKILQHLGLRTYKTNWGVLKIVKAAYMDAKKHGDLTTAKNIKYAFVRDNMRYAWQ